MGAVITVVDLLVVVVVALAVVHGWRSSGVTRLGRLAGLVVGLLVGLALAGSVLRYGAGPWARALIGLAAVLGCAALGAAFGGRVGSWLAYGLRRIGLRAADSVVGSALSGLLAFALCWLALAVLGVLDVTSLPGTGLHGAAERVLGGLGDRIAP